MRNTRYLSTIFLTVSGLILFGCLDRPLDIHSEGEEKFVPQINPLLEEHGNGENPNIEPPSPLERLLKDTYHQKEEADKEDILLEELIRYRDNPKELALSMKEIRVLQESYMEILPQLPGVDETALLPKYKINLNTSAPCPQKKPEIKKLSNGLRLVTFLPRKDPCVIEHSKKFEEALNSLLQGPELELSYSGETRLVDSFDDLRSFLQESGFELKVSYRSYLAPFFRLYEPSGDIHKAQNEIPLPLWLDTRLKSSRGKDLIVPAIHSEVFFHWSHPEEPDAFVKIYFSDKGFVFDDDDYALPHWSGERHLLRFTKEQVNQIFQDIPPIHQAFELFRSRSKVPLAMGGFGLLGVCNDGAALLVRSVMGENYPLPFPLVRTDLIDMPKGFPAEDVWRGLVSDSSKEALQSPIEDKARARFLKRLLNSNPFSSPSDFPDYDQRIIEIREELEEATR